MKQCPSMRIAAFSAALSLALSVGCKPRADESKTLNSGGADSADIVSWVDGQAVSDWKTEISKRDKAIYDYVEANDAGTAQRYGFTNNQTPAQAWDWFENKPVGLGGVPFVLFRTLALMEDSSTYYTKLADAAKDVAKGSSFKIAFKSYFGSPLPDFTAAEISALRAVARIWHQPSTVDGQKNLDHIGLLPHPANYSKSGDRYAPTFKAVNDPGIQKHPLPYGLVYESTADSAPSASDTRPALLKNLANKVSGEFQIKTKLAINKLVWDKLGYNKSTDDNPETFGKPTKYDNVFFSCAGCHVGRVVTDTGDIRFMYGAPNTEIEAQYYSQILRDTASLLVESGFDVRSNKSQVPENGKKPEPNVTAVVALAKAMVMTVMVSPQKFYGNGADPERRALYQATQLLDNFGGVIGDLIGTGIKTHFIYNAVAGNNAFKGSNNPDLLANRAGQMDAFGIASGLVAIHSYRSSFKNGNKTLAPSFIEFMYRLNPQSPFFTGFDGLGSPETIKGMTAQDLKRNGESDAEYFAKVGKKIRDSISAWAPPEAAPIDIKNLNFSKDRVYANWDGNQGASARTLASGASATGDPRKVNVRIHEPLNPFIGNLPPSPYPFDVDLAKAKEGKKLFNSTCANCHKPKNSEIYDSKMLGVDDNRTRVNTEVSRHGLAAMTLEACFYYIRNGNDSAGSPGKPGTDRDWCLPKDLQGKWGSDSKDFDKVRSMTKEQYESFMGDYFVDTPKRVADNKAGFKADMLYGIWSNAPFLHNGSVPTLAHLICSNTRPAKFIRGNINYDSELVGFVWDKAPTRYNRYDMTNFKTFDTGKNGWSNTGHNFGKQYCGDVGSLGQDATQDQIAAAIKTSPELESLLEYLKTL